MCAWHIASTVVTVVCSEACTSPWQQSSSSFCNFWNIASYSFTLYISDVRSFCQLQFRPVQQWWKCPRILGKEKTTTWQKHGRNRRRNDRETKESTHKPTVTLCLITIVDKTYWMGGTLSLLAAVWNYEKKREKLTTRSSCTFKQKFTWWRFFSLDWFGVDQIVDWTRSLLAQWDSNHP